MNFDYFDIISQGDAPAINDPAQVRDEMLQLKDIADKIGSYRWNYKEDFSKAPDNNEHIGIVAQQLLQVPGLEAAVSQDPETGVLTVDTQYVALAALGLVSALARFILNNNKETEYGTNSTSNIPEVSGEVSDTASSAGDFGITESETLAEQEPEEAGANAESAEPDDLSNVGPV